MRNFDAGTWASHYLTRSSHKCNISVQQLLQMASEPGCEYTCIDSN